MLSASFLIPNVVAPTTWAPQSTNHLLFKIIPQLVMSMVFLEVIIFSFTFVNCFLIINECVQIFFFTLAIVIDGYLLTI